MKSKFIFTKPNKYYLRFLILAFFLFLTCSYKISFASEASSSNAATITASAENLSVSFTYGFEKCSKYGRKMNVTVNITNTGKNFSGTIGILSVPYNDSEQTLYEIPLVLAGGETKKIELNATVSASNWPSLLIKDEKERTVLQKSFRVNMTTEPNVIFTGILTDTADDMSYFGSTELAKMFLLDETSLPSTAAGLDALDIIVISNFSTTRLSDEQKNALLSWTKKGGMLVFGTGATAMKTLSAFENTLFDGTIGEPQPRILSFKKSVKKDMVFMDFENFIPILSEADDFPLLIKQTYGKGTVLAAAFELGLPSKYRDSIGTKLYETILNNLSTTKQNQLEYQAFHDYYALSRALGVSSITSYPHLKLYFYILILYALLTGPILYFILKKLDKRHLLWMLMPASCLICTIVIYLVGSNSRITEPYIHYLSFLNIDQSSQQSAAQQDVYFNITSPYNKSYSVTLPHVTDVDIRGDDYSYYSISYDYTTQPKESSYYKTAFYQDGSDATTLIMNDYASFHAACFHCTLDEDPSAITGTIKHELALKEDFTVTGTISNQFGMDFIQAIYLCNGQLYILGELKQGDTISLDDCESCLFTSANSLQSNILSSGEIPLEVIAGCSGWDSDSTLLERQMYFALDYYFSSDSSLFSSNGRLIAITEQGDVAFLKDNELDTIGLQILDITMEPISLGDLSVQTLEQTLASVIEGNADYPEYRWIYDNQIIKYHIDQPERVVSLVYPEGGNAEFFRESTQNNIDNLAIFEGTISAYNTKTGAYDVLFTSGTSGTCKDLSPYISASGQLTIRYEVADNRGNFEYGVPYLYLTLE